MFFCVALVSLPAAAHQQLCVSCLLKEKKLHKGILAPRWCRPLPVACLNAGITPRRALGSLQSTSRAESTRKQEMREIHARRVEEHGNANAELVQRILTLVHRGGTLKPWLSFHRAFTRILGRALRHAGTEIPIDVRAAGKMRPLGRYFHTARATKRPHETDPSKAVCLGPRDAEMCGAVFPAAKDAPACGKCIEKTREAFLEAHPCALPASCTPH